MMVHAGSGGDGDVLLVSSQSGGKCVHSSSLYIWK